MGSNARMLVIILVLLGFESSAKAARILQAEHCRLSELSITQRHVERSGQSLYVVEISNNCVDGCPPSDIHIACGSFTSSIPVDPAVFRKLSFDDCLVNNGILIEGSGFLTFQYSSPSPYPLTLKSAFLC